MTIAHCRGLSQLLFTSLLVFGTWTGAGAQAQDKFIVMASTTSTEQSGLFAHLLPAFKQASGVDVRVVALGTGQALDSARRGDVDVVFVHDPAAEEKFVAEGFGPSAAFRPCAAVFGVPSGRKKGGKKGEKGRLKSLSSKRRRRPALRACGSGSSARPAPHEHRRPCLQRAACGSSQVSSVQQCAMVARRRPCRIPQLEAARPITGALRAVDQTRRQREIRPACAGIRMLARHASAYRRQTCSLCH